MSSHSVTLSNKGKRVTARVLTTQTAAQATTSHWGWLPAISVISTSGLLLIAARNILSGNNSDWAMVVFWLGLLTLIVPGAARLFMAEVKRRERLGLVVLIGISLYLVKILHSPLAFTFHDELVHWRTANDILQSHHLFAPNPVIAVSPLYPGLQIVTNALMSQTGLDIFGAGVIIVILARLVLLLSLYFLFEEASGSARIAGLAALVYMANPNFVFFDAQYAYESLALPLAVMVIWAEARRVRSSGRNRIGLSIAVIAGLSAVVVTHHLTSYALVGFFGLWIVTNALRRSLVRLLYVHTGRITPLGLARTAVRSAGILWRTEQNEGDDTPRHTGILMLSLVMSLAWLIYVAAFTIGYLAPVLGGALTQILQLIAGESSGRQLFKGSAGQVAPLWEQIAGYMSVLLILAGLPFGLWQAWKQRVTGIALALAVCAVAYPATLALRLTVAGWEVSNRTSEFIFIPVAFVVALGLVRFRFFYPSTTFRTIALTACATVGIMGALMLGWPPYARLPGSYLVEADTRSIQPESVAAAYWVRDYLGSGNAMTADRDNNLLMISYGEQNSMLNVGNSISVGPVYFSKTLGPVEKAILRTGHIRYLVVDKRLSTGLPMVGVYFNNGEPDANQHTTPLDPAALAKFETIPGVKRVFDSGNIIIYDVGAISGAS